MTWGIDCRFLLITMALIHSYFVDIFVHGKLLHSSASRTHVTIYDVKKCQQNTLESMPKCYYMNFHLQNYTTKAFFFPVYILHLPFLVFELFYFDAWQIKMGHPINDFYVTEKKEKSKRNKEFYYNRILCCLFMIMFKYYFIGLLHKYWH